MTNSSTLTPTNFPIHHIGVAVFSLDKAVSYYQDTLNVSFLSQEILPGFGVEVVFLSTGNTLIELITPVNPNEGAVAKFLKNRGEGLHHICFEVKNLLHELSRLKEQGVKLIDEVPRAGAHNMTVAFIHPDQMSGVLVEFCELCSSVTSSV